MSGADTDDTAAQLQHALAHSLRRQRFATALRAALRLSTDGRLTVGQHVRESPLRCHCRRISALNACDSPLQSALKDLILDSDPRVLAVMEVFEVDQDMEEMLDTLIRIARRAAE